MEFVHIIHSVLTQIVFINKLGNVGFFHKRDLVHICFWKKKQLKSLIWNKRNKRLEANDVDDMWR